MPLSTTPLSHFNPRVGAHFIALGHNTTGSLQQALHHSTLSSNSTLHSIKPHIEEVAKVFDKSYIKNAIRSGGLSDSQQKNTYRKILGELAKKDPQIMSNELKKRAIKAVVSHFEFGKGVVEAHTKEAIKARTVKRYRAEEHDPEGPAVSSVNDARNRQAKNSDGEPTTSHLGSVEQKHTAHSISISDKSSGHYSGIAQKMRKLPPNTSGGASRPTNLKNFKLAA